MKKRKTEAEDLKNIEGPTVRQFGHIHTICTLHMKSLVLDAVVLPILPMTSLKTVAFPHCFLCFIHKCMLFFIAVREIHASSS